MPPGSRGCSRDRENNPVGSLPVERPAQKKRGYKRWNRSLIRFSSFHIVVDVGRNGRGPNTKMQIYTPPGNISFRKQEMISKHETKPPGLVQSKGKDLSYILGCKRMFLRTKYL